MPNRREMNSWGARKEAIEILKWGDPQESLQFLRRHQDYRHIKRMVLELEGREKEAAARGERSARTSRYARAAGRGVCWPFGESVARTLRLPGIIAISATRGRLMNVRSS